MENIIINMETIEKVKLVKTLLQEIQIELNNKADDVKIMGLPSHIQRRLYGQADEIKILLQNIFGENNSKDSNQYQLLLALNLFENEKNQLKENQ